MKCHNSAPGRCIQKLHVTRVYIAGYVDNEVASIYCETVYIVHPLHGPAVYLLLYLTRQDSITS